jgi:carboxypeptidase Taq
MQPEQAYQELIRYTRETALLSSCIELLGWDEETYMPGAGVEHRAKQLTFLTGMHHQRSTDPRLTDLLHILENSDLVRDAQSVEAINVRELRRHYERFRRLPRRLVEALAHATTLGQQAWCLARQKDDYAVFAPWLEQVVALKREEAEAVGYTAVSYDALLEEHEPGLRTEDVVRLFAQLRPPLTALVAEATTAARKTRNVNRKAPFDVLQGEFPIERQKTFGEMVAAAVGFDFRGGRLDVAAHPSCCSVGPGDCRITTRYHPQHFSAGFFSIMHEVGHGLYEQGLDPIHHSTPVGEVGSVALHESQARLWENTVARSRPFWQHFFPPARQIFHEALGSVSESDFTLAVHHVEPTLIRVQADEVTYNLHILIRFELERALVSGDLKPADLPSAWNDAYRRDLGIVPANDAEGCLQDGHWAAGLFGYFPTYTLGNLFAAQFFARARAELGDLDRQMAHGDFRSLLDWLRQKIYRQGGRYRASELIERVTGSPPAPESLLLALREKYAVREP